MVEDPEHEFWYEEENLYEVRGCSKGIVLLYARSGSGEGGFMIVKYKEAPLRVAERLRRYVGELAPGGVKHVPEMWWGWRGLGWRFLSAVRVYVDRRRMRGPAAVAPLDRSDGWGMRGNE